MTRPPGVHNKSPNARAKATERIESDFMRNFVAMGEPSSVMDIDSGHICGVCGQKAVKLLVFVTGTVNSCKKHYDRFIESRRELWRRHYTEYNRRLPK